MLIVVKFDTTHKCTNISENCIVTLAPTLGRRRVSALLRFSINSIKTAARSAAKFFLSIYLLIFRAVCKRWPPIAQGQVTRSLGMTRCQVIFFHLYRCARAAVDDQTLWNSVNGVRPWVPTICICWIFPIGDLSSDQFCGLPIIRQLEKNQIPPLRIRPGYFIMHWVILGYCWWFRCKFWSVTLIEVI